MDSELCARIANLYMKKYMAYWDVDTKGFYNDMGNPIFCFKDVGKYMKELDDSTRKAFIPRFRDTIRMMREYFTLLDTYPKFRDSELAERKGCFPDIYDYVYSSEGVDEQRRLFGGSSDVHRHYVMLAKQRLESGSHDD